MEHDLDRLMALFRLLSDRTRLSLLLALTEGEQNVTALARRLGLPQPSVSHHLALLKLHNLLGSRRNGKQIIYSLNGTVEHASRDLLRLRADPFTVELAIRRSDR